MVAFSDTFRNFWNCANNFSMNQGFTDWAKNDAGRILFCVFKIFFELCFGSNKIRVFWYISVSGVCDIPAMQLKIN